MDDPGPLVAGKMRFVQHRLPALESGAYRLSFRQDVTIDGPGAATDAFGEVVHFAVAGDRFTLAANELDSVFPPRGTTGEFCNVMPHVVLTRRTLPWERSPDDGPAVTGNSTADVPGWLALLVFDQDEQVPAVHPGTVAGLQAPDGTLAFSGLALQYGETSDDPCNCIDVDGALFAAIAPTQSDLKWLAHVRSVRAGGKPGQAPADPDAPADYAVVVANRLPCKGHRTTVHLVSLEGLEDYLPGDDGAAPAKTAPTLRLASLASWSFNSVDERETFATVIEDITRPDRGGGGVGPLCFPAPDPPPPAVALGYVGLMHQLRDGGRTASWYRGPFIPYAAPATLAVPLGSADAALAYDPDAGLLDASYAAAWQLGVLLGLQSKDYCARLLRWKHAVKRECLSGLERAFLATRIGADAAPGGPAALRAAATERLKAALAGLHAPVTEGGPAAAQKPRPAPTRLAGAAIAGHLADGLTLRTAVADAPALPDPIQAWLDALRRLHGVPFPYLVPDERLLPPESLRFFYLDPNWVEALVDGAFSLGTLTAGDAAVHAAVVARLRAAADWPPAPITGFLLRSRAVKGWPGLEATPRTTAGVELKLLRYERLSGEVLLGLVDGRPDAIDFHEPPEGLHFGFDVPEGETPGPAALQKDLRHPLTAEPYRIGGVQQAVKAPGCYRAGGLATGGPVLDVTALAAAIAAAVAPLSAVFTAAEFGMEMVEGVELVTVDWSA